VRFYPIFFLAYFHVRDTNGWLCPLFRNNFSYSEEVISFLCSPCPLGRCGVRVTVVQGSAECHHPLSRAAQSVTTRCPGQRRVSPPVVQGSVKCPHPLSGAAWSHHPLSRAARSVCHPLSRSTPKMVLTLSPYKSYTKEKMFQCCPCRHRAMDTCCPGRRRVLPPVVQGDRECYHPLSRAAWSVTSRCPGWRRILIVQLRVSNKFQNFL